MRDFINAWMCPSSELFKKIEMQNKKKNNSKGTLGRGELWTKYSAMIL